MENMILVVEGKEMAKEDMVIFNHRNNYLYEESEEQTMNNTKLTEQDKYELACGQFAMLAEGKFNTEENGVKVGRYPTMKMFNICYNHTAGFRTEEGKELLPIIQRAFELSYRKSYRNSLEIEKVFKEIPVINTLAIDATFVQGQQHVVDVEDENGTIFNIEEKNKDIELLFNIRIENKQEGEVVRNCKIEKRTIADKIQSQSGLFTSDIININVKGDKNSSYVMDKFVELIDDIDIEKVSLNKKGLFVILHKSGFCEVATSLMEAKDKVRIGDEIYQYVFGYDTPSSLKKAGVTAFKINTFAVEKSDVNAETNKIVLIEHKDIRTEIIDASLDGALKAEFQDENGDWVFLKSKEDLFKKYKTRVGLGAPASKRLPLKMKNYIVVDNIANNAGYNFEDYTTVCDSNNPNFVDCKDTKDGTTFVAAEYLYKNLKALDINIDFNTIKNICIQTRGGGTKDSAQTPVRAFNKVLAKKILNRGAKVEYVVIDGVKYWQPSKETIEKAINNIDGLFDSNAMKLMKHDPDFDVVVMKKAHQSESCLNMAVNIALLIANNKETITMLEEKGKEQILEAFNQFGIDIKFDEDGLLEDVSVNYDRIKGINSASQDVEWLRNCAPEIMDAINPGYLMTKFDGITKSLSKKIEHLRFDVDCRYSVVQADPAPLFGVRILNDDEVFDPTCAEPRVSFVRHPMSGIHAVSTWNCVNLIEIISRINKLKGITNEDREALKEYYATVSGFIVIPASHYLMEKHDGMDFDIDAGQEFRDPAVVDIFAQVCELGTIIDRSKDVKANCSTSLCAEELVIQDWASKRSGESFIPLKRPQTDEKTIQKRNIVADSNTGKGHIRLSNKFTKTKVNNEKENFDIIDGKYAASYHNNLLLFKQYQLNPVAPIGLIATGFYNNALLYSFITNPEVSKSDKEYICKFLHSKFGDEGDKEYISPLNKETIDNKIKYTLDKKSVIETLFRYAESDGSLESTTAFIFDTLICNRYVAESSIDSAKKMYMVADYFNFCDIFRSLGSDKNVHVRQLFDEENTNVFNDLTARFNFDGSYGENNFFDVKFLGLMYNALADNTFKKDSALQKVKSGKITDETTPLDETNKMKVSIGIKDELFQLRSRLTEFANDLIYLVSKTMEAKVKSIDANKIRETFKSTDIDENALLIVSNTNSVGITMSSAIVVDEIDDMAAKTYKDKNVKSTLKNTALLGFNGGELQYSDIEIGEAVVNYLIQNYEKSDASKCRRSANMVLSVYMKEVIAFLNSVKNIDVDFVYGEKIQRMNNNNKNVSFVNQLNNNATIINGRGEIDNSNIEISCKNKKATISGEIKEISGSYYIVGNREDSFEQEESSGIFAAIKNTANYTSRKAITAYEKNLADSTLSSKLAEMNPDFLNDYELKFSRRLKINNEILYNVISIVNEDGRTLPFCELNISNTVADILNKIDMDMSSLLFFCDGEYGVIQIRNEKIETAISDAKIAESISLDDEIENDIVMDDENDFDPFACFFNNNQNETTVSNDADSISDDIAPIM